MLANLTNDVISVLTTTESQPYFFIANRKDKMDVAYDVVEACLPGTGVFVFMVFFLTSATSSFALMRFRARCKTGN